MFRGIGRERAVVFATKPIRGVANRRLIGGSKPRTCQGQRQREADEAGTQHRFVEGCGGQRARRGRFEAGGGPVVQGEARRPWLDEFRKRNR